MTPRFRLLVLLVGLLPLCGRADPIVLRVGYFPNVTHAQGVIGAQGTRTHQGWFEQRLGPDVTIQWYSYNAGPSAMEALLAGSIDLTYVGPNPALNAYIRSEGEEIRLLAGAAQGGAALVVRTDSGITQPADFKGRKVATPQLGNTQDVAARVWLVQQGFTVTVTGGDVNVIPTPNPDQLSLFQTKRIDAAWTVETWVSRLVQEGGGKIFHEQPDAITTVLVASVGLLRTHPELAAKFRQAHAELTAWVNAHPAEAQALVREGLGAELKRPVPAALVAAAWPHLTFTTELRREQLTRLVADAQSVGFLRDALPLDRLFSAQP